MDRQAPSDGLFLVIQSDERVQFNKPLVSITTLDSYPSPERFQPVSRINTTVRLNHLTYFINATELMTQIQLELQMNFTD